MQALYNILDQIFNIVLPPRFFEVDERIQLSIFKLATMSMCIFSSVIVFYSVEYFGIVGLITVIYLGQTILCVFYMVKKYQDLF